MTKIYEYYRFSLIFMNISYGSFSDIFTSMGRLALFCDFENFSVILNPNFIHILLCNIMKIWDHKILTMTKTLTKLGICTKFNNWNIAFQSWHQHLRPPVTPIQSTNIYLLAGSKFIHPIVKYLKFISHSQNQSTKHIL